MSMDESLDLTAIRERLSLAEWAAGIDGRTTDPYIADVSALLDLLDEAVAANTDLSNRLRQVTAERDDFRAVSLPTIAAWRERAEAAEAEVTRLRRDLDAAVDLCGQVQEWYTAYRRKHPAG